MKEKFTLLLVIVPLACFSPGKTFLKELFNSLKLHRLPVLSYAASPHNAFLFQYIRTGVMKA